MIRQLMNPPTGHVLMRCLDRIKKNNIRLVCFDFDRTAYRGHTGGVLDLPIVDLAPTMHQMVSDLSPDFLSLVRVLRMEHIGVAVVTFNDAMDNRIELGKDMDMVRIGGEPLIRPVLNMGLTEEIACNIPIYALNPWWRNQTKQVPPYFPYSKKWHLSRAMDHFGVLRTSQVLLIDDSSTNIKDASSAGFQTMYVPPGSGSVLSQLWEQPWRDHN
jgi:hypothetical protein